ncbi:RNA polymerase sigma factor [Ructibacterium gallinarum]|uniref:Sigma-70 family RNA polymerase sigma factor n=1 Tax=Ructibacterium gallinarum TaxID=2779355 RepID=A0A9D5M233_9FIRM|nr:sigma-70 family RNA polymerase sigma factor [Ructibacterium gallinarum]MBE5039185.1 sigma-70 family RNA polymerase sigma factor [Ructibacterium gallinarum]
MDITDELYKKHYHGALLYVYSLCGNYHLAEDIVSESFYKALVSYQDTEERFKFWLFRVCKNAFIDFLRRNKNKTELKADLQDETDIADRVIVQEKYRSLYRAVELLQPEYQEVITLFYFNEMRISEIAVITNKSPAAVKVALYRARKKLKEILEVNYGF